MIKTAFIFGSMFIMMAVLILGVAAEGDDSKKPYVPPMPEVKKMNLGLPDFANKDNQKKQMMIHNASLVPGPEGRMLIKIQSGGKVMFKGYEVTASHSETILKTPEGAVYVNGILPLELVKEARYVNSYGEYQYVNPSAPAIEGPGWEQP